MAQVTVKIKINANAENLYVVGSTKNLGEWNPKSAKEAKDGVVSVRFEEGQFVEYKVLSAKTWDKVEKGVNGEELENHSFVASKNLKTVEIDVAKFN